MASLSAWLIGRFWFARLHRNVELEGYVSTAGRHDSSHPPILGQDSARKETEAKLT